MTDRELLEVLLEKVTNIDNRLERVEQKMTAIEMTIENELQPNIMRVAEGHIDLYRNLKDVKGALEMIDGKHENEIQKIKLAK